MTREGVDTFWTFVTDLGDEFGVLRVCDRAGVDLAGEDYEPIVGSWGGISSNQDRDDKIFDVPGLTLELSNFPVLSTGERVSDLLQGYTLETARGTLYLNLRDRSTGENAQEEIFVGVAQASDADLIGYDFRRAKLSLKSLAEHYLGPSALRTITKEDHPSIRQADIGATIPIVIGDVPRVPGRVAKGSNKTTPVAATANTSDAQLTDFTVLPSAISQDWTLVFSSTDTSAVQHAYDGEAEVGKRPALPTVAAVASGRTTSNVASMTLSAFDCAGASVLDVIVHRQLLSSNAVTSVTYGGTALQQIFADIHTVTLGTQTFRLSFPQSGSHDIVVTMNAASEFVVNAVAMKDADFTINSIFQTATSATSISATCNTLPTGDVLVDHAGRSGSGTLTPNAGQTLQTSASTTGGSGVVAAVSTKTPIATTTTTGWAVSGSGSPADLYGRRYTGIRDAYGQSFTIGSTQKLRRIKLQLRANAAAAAPYAGISTQLYLFTDVGGHPGAEVARSNTGVDGTTTAIYSFEFGGVVIAAGTYWIVQLAPCDSAGVGKVLWSKNSSGGYSGGKASKGRAITYGAMLPAGYRTIDTDWSGGMDSQDFWFECTFEAAVFDAYGSVTGYAGFGSTTSVFVTSDENIEIDPGNWSGTPAGGDRYTFSVNLDPNFIIFGESPLATPNKSLSGLWWDDVLFDPTGGEIVSITGGDAVWLIGGSGTIGQTFKFASNKLIGRMAFLLQKQGGPTGNISVSVGLANLQGSAPSESSSTIASGSISLSSIPFGSGAVGGGDFVDVEFPAPFIARAGVPYAVILSAEPDPGAAPITVGNAVIASVEYTSPYTDGVQFRKGPTDSQWAVDPGHGLCMKIYAATATTSLSADDGTGHYVTKVALDVEIPDTVNVSAAMTGWSDPGGVYTGSPGSLIVRPDAVVHVLMNWWGVTDAEIDLDDSFTRAATNYGSLYRFDGVAQDDETRKALLLRLAFESKAAPAWFAGLFEWNYLSTTLDAPVATFAIADLVREDDGRPILSVRRSPTVKVVNFVDVRYQRKHELSRSLTSYAQIVNAQNLVSILGPSGTGTDGFGKRENPEKFMLDFVRSDAMAVELAEDFASRFGLPYRIVEVTLPLKHIAIESDDTIAYDLRA